MTAVMTASGRTGSLLDGPVQAKRPIDRPSTEVDVNAIKDVLVRDAISAWRSNCRVLSVPLPVGWIMDEAASIELQVGMPLVWISHPVVLPDDEGEELDADRDAASVVRSLEDRLGLPLSQILQAAKIRRRTFYAWEAKAGTQPRLKSQGRLWALAQCVDDLEDVLGNSLRRWLSTDSERLRLLSGGHFDELTELAVRSVERGPAIMPRPASAVGEDVVLPPQRSGRTTPAARPARRAAGRRLHETDS